MKAYLCVCLLIATAGAILGVALPWLISQPDDAAVAVGFILAAAFPVFIFVLVRRFIRDPAVRRLAQSAKEKINA